MSTGQRRPWTVTVVSLTMLLMAICIALLGLLASAMSSCCGSRDPSDPTPAMAGLVVATVVTVAAIGLWVGAMSRRTLLATTFVAPVSCVIASAGSVDLAALFPFTALAWGLFWVFLSRPRTAAWIR